MSAIPKLEIRNLKFAIGPGVPRYWHGGRRSVTIFLNNLSIFFPEGEKFFIKSVKAFANRVTDPKLAADVKAFYAQEGVHSREHVRYNKMLRDQGYPIDKLEHRVEQILKLVQATLPKRFQLSATCALEHFTALMAGILLEDPKLLEGAHPAMAALWKWHAAEENEHKAVAFDVYKQVAGNYPERAVVMAIASVIFWALVIEYQYRLMKTDGIHHDPQEWAALLRFLFVEPGGMPRMIREYVKYYKPGFHPWDIDNSALLEAWRKEFATSPEYKSA